MIEGAEGYSNQSLRLSKQEEYTWIVSGCVQLAFFTFKLALFAHLECLDCNFSLQYFFVDCAAISLGLNLVSMFE